MEWFAMTRWCWEDVQSVKEDWSKKECEDFLEQYGKYIAETQVQHGWMAIETFVEAIQLEEDLEKERR